MSATTEQPRAHIDYDDVVSLADIPEDVYTYAKCERLQRLAASMGEAAMRGAFEQAGEQRYASLLEAAQAAAEGDKVAKKFVLANMRADAVERSIKAGIVMPIKLERDEDDRIMQHGQTLEDIQVQSLAYVAGGIMKERVPAEARNAIRLQNCADQGLLKDNYFVVFSPYTDSKDKAAAKQAGFFVKTKTASIQATTEVDGEIVMESSYVAGVKTPDAPRHDIDAIIKIGALFGVDFSGKTDAEIIDTPLLIPKKYMPNGVIDIDKLYDDFAGGTFMGQDAPRKDYVAFRAECDNIVASFEPKVEEMYEEFIGLAHSLRTPTDATKLLHDLSEKHMVEFAVHNDFIDPDAFGAAAAADIAAARYYMEIGEYELAAQATVDAQENAESYSCPTGLSGDAQETTSENDDCEFISKVCPSCGKRNVKTVTKKDAKGRLHVSGSCGCSKVYP